MPFFSLKKIEKITIIYWLLLIYIMAALIWWFISLENQNRQMTDLKKKDLITKMGSNTSSLAYEKELSGIISEKKRNTTKYISEGITFLILSIIGAIFVYRSIRKQLKAQLQQQNFMMAVTHELKTPISVAKLNLETLQKHNLDPEKQKKLIQMTLQETSRLNTLINNILVSSQLESEKYGITREELDLSRLFQVCIQGYRNRFSERTFIEEINTDLEVTGDELLLQMMINNLLDNAVKYSPKEKPVICRLKSDKHKIILNIIDEGIGIEENEKLLVFDKFYRTGNELTRRTQGTGLGLYLCSKIAKDHNADISVTNHKPYGSNFEVIFH